MTPTEEIKKELEKCDKGIKAAELNDDQTERGHWRSIEYGIRIACRILGVDLGQKPLKG